MSRTVVLTLFVVIVVAGLIAVSLRGVREARCEVCITFKGQTVCREGEGRTKEEAQRTAAEACCAVLPTEGMAERIKCSQSQPTSLQCY